MSSVDLERFIVYWATAALCIGPFVCSAHGPAPSVIDALGNASGAVSIVRTNIGLAVPRTAGGFRYICPAQWGEEDRFPPISRMADGAFLLATDGRIHRGDGCTFESRDIENWTGRYGGLSGAILVERHAAGGVFWDVSAEPRVLFTVDEGHIDSHVHHETGVYYGRSRGPITIQVWTQDGGHTTLITQGPEADYVSLRTIEPLTALVSTQNGPELYLIRDGRAERIGRANRAIHGPVRWAGALYFLADGVLTRWADGQSMALQPVEWTCLFTIDEQPHACVQRNLHRVQTNETWHIGPAVFQFDDFIGVDEGCPGTEPLRTQCLAQWYHFGAEAGLVDLDGLTLESDGNEDQPDGSLPLQAAPAGHSGRESRGCMGLHGTPAPVSWLLFLGCALARCLRVRRVF